MNARSGAARRTARGSAAVAIATRRAGGLTIRSHFRYIVSRAPARTSSRRTAAALGMALQAQGKGTAASTQPSERMRRSIMTMLTFGLLMAAGMIVWMWHAIPDAP